MTAPTFKVGDRVHNVTDGYGTVKRVAEPIYQVEFDNGYVIWCGGSPGAFRPLITAVPS